MQIEVGQLGPAAKTVEFEHDTGTRDSASSAAQQCGGRANASTRGEHVVENENALPLRDVVGLHFKSGLTVFERVVLRDHAAGQLARFADGNDPNAGTVGNGGGEHKAAGFDTGNRVEAAGKSIPQLIDDGTEPVSIGQNRRQVAKLNSRLGKVRNGCEEGEHCWCCGFGNDG